MEEKRYLKWYNKVGYGSGDVAGNVVYAFLSTFVMLYLTNTVGLNPGIVGTLIAVSKLFDGVTDIFFGSMIDKTKTKMGKAKPWMLYGYIGCAVFYTANNIAYSALTALITKNSKERVEMGSYRFIFAFSTSLLIQSVTIKFVEIMGGGAAGWRIVAIIYAIIGLIINTVSALSVKELPEEVLNEDASSVVDEKYSLIEAAKLLFSNRFYIMICVTYILQQIYSAMLSMGIYYMMYVLKNEDLFPVFSWAINIPLIIALVITPSLVAKWKGLYKLNLVGYTIGTIGRALVVVAAYMGSVPLMIAFTAVAAFGMGPWQGDMNAVIANCSEYTYLTKHKCVDGTMYSCTSLGVKLGGGLGTAITGWLLEFSHFNSSLAVQPDSCLSMLHTMYLWIPVVICVIITFIMSQMNVEKANEELKNSKMLKAK